MKQRSSVFEKSVLIVLTILLMQSYGAIKHKFIAIDEGLGRLLYVNEYDSTKNWIDTLNRKVSGDTLAAFRDMQLVGNNRILIGHNRGYNEYDLTTGAVKKQLITYDSVSSVRRLPGGYTLLAGVDLDTSHGVIILKLDSTDKIIKRITFPGTYVRLIRQTSTGTFMMACNDTIKEGDTTGTFIWKKYLTGTPAANKHMWKIVRLDNSNLFLSAGYGAFLAEVNLAGTIVKTIGATPQPTGVNPYFYGMWQKLTNNNVVVANWEGHGAGNGSKGIELLEFDTTGTIVWQWNKSAIISSLQGVMVLDSLDTSLLYDDRNGYMKPLVSTSTIKHSSTSLQNKSSSYVKWRTQVKTSGAGITHSKTVDISGRSSLQSGNSAGKTSAGIYLYKQDAGK